MTLGKLFGNGKDYTFQFNLEIIHVLTFLEKACFRLTSFVGLDSNYIPFHEEQYRSKNPEYLRGMEEELSFWT